jgi:fibro-slime domain-containing protein
MKNKLAATAAVGCLLMCGAQTAFANTLNLTATIRDFNANGTTQGGVAGNPDFENAIADDRGIVGPIGAALGVDNKPVYAGGAGTVTTHGAAAFNEWYNVSGVNRLTTTTLTADDTGSPGIFHYTNNNYFPINGQLLGNQNGSQNFGFTTEIHTQFTYQLGQTFSFSGDDDVFVFINKKLALDLGGVHGAESDSVNLDTLGLTVGVVYALDLFAAERHTTASNFSFTTSAVLQDVPQGTPLPGALPLFASGLGALGILVHRRRRKALFAR